MLDEAALVLVTKVPIDFAVVGLRDGTEQGDGVEKATEEACGAARPERESPREIACEPASLVAVLLHPRRAAHDVAEERIAQRLEHAARVERRERSKDVRRRAKRVE